jgi:outer membrane protein assembly factor BamD
MSAFASYMGRQYADAIGSATRFAANNPGNKDAPYAYYLIAISHYEQIGRAERDQTATQQALDALNTVIDRYPDTRYAADARLKKDLVRDQLAAKEMNVGRFYQDRGQWLAATLRFREVVDEYETTRHVEEALYRLTESYLALGIPEEARKAAAVLGANYPGGEWYERAYALMQRKAPQGLG